MSLTTTESKSARALTLNQTEVLAKLRKRGFYMLADATEYAWKAGQTYYIDPRAGVPRSFSRAFNLGNREALKTS